MNMSIDDFVLNTMLKIKYKSEWTYLHCKQVGNLAVAFGKRLNISNKGLKTLRYMGYLHDTGKLYMDKKILDSTKKLTSKEYEKIKKHPLDGYNYLNENLPNCKDRDLILAACLFHHYREDKKGYPSVSELKDITYDFYVLHENPLVEIISICDAFNAIIMDRPYSKGKTMKEALELIIYNAKTQFNEELSFLFYSFVVEDILKIDKINLNDYLYEENKIFLDLVISEYEKGNLEIEDYKLYYLNEYNKYLSHVLRLCDYENDITFNKEKEKYIISLIESLVSELDIETIYIDNEEEIFEDFLNEFNNITNELNNASKSLNNLNKEE